MLGAVELKGSESVRRRVEVEEGDGKVMGSGRILKPREQWRLEFLEKDSGRSEDGDFLFMVRVEGGERRGCGG